MHSSFVRSIKFINIVPELITGALFPLQGIPCWPPLLWRGIVNLVVTTVGISQIMLQSKPMANFMRGCPSFVKWG
jgi:hypothetical protein